MAVSGAIGPAAIGHRMMSSCVCAPIVPTQP